jgi:tetratricopeptide (TPR) repeat protein
LSLSLIAVSAGPVNLIFGHMRRSGDRQRERDGSVSEHNEALEKYQRVLATDPDNHVALFNAGLATYLLGRPEQSVAYWARLKELVPEDWRVRSKLIQAYQALGRGRERDDERAGLLQLRSVTQDEELRRARKYCRDQFTVGDSQFLVFEFFELEGDWPIRYSFDVLDSSGQRVAARYTLGAYKTTNAYARDAGQIQPGQRMFHLDGYKPGGVHETYGFFVGEPDYDTVKSAILQILQGTRQSVSSSHPTPE